MLPTQGHSALGGHQGLIPGQGTGSHMPQLKTLPAKTKTEDPICHTPMHVSIPPRKSVGWQLVPTGEKQGGSSKQMVLAASRNVPQILFSEPASQKQQAHTLSWPWETQESQVSSSTRAAAVSPKLGDKKLTESGGLAGHSQKPTKQPGW